MWQKMSLNVMISAGFVGAGRDFKASRTWRRRSKSRWWSSMDEHSSNFASRLVVANGARAD
jgi:hypothetical protein